MSRSFLAAALAAACVAFAPCALAQVNQPSGGSGAAKTTTVKSSKSNTSDRKGQTTEPSGAAKTTTVKSSKSNTSDRKGSAAGATGPAKAINLNSSRSN